MIFFGVLCLPNSLHIACEVSLKL